MHREAVLGDPDALEVGRRARGGVARTVAGGPRGRRATCVPTPTSPPPPTCIVTFLWGLFVEYLTRHDPTVGGRIDAFAALLAPALRRRP